MRVVIIQSYAPSIFTFRKELLESILEKRNDLWVILPFADSKIQKGLKKLGAKYVHLPIDRRRISPIKDLMLILKMILILKRISPHIVLSFTLKPIIYGSIASSIASVPHRYSMLEGRGSVFTQKARSAKIVEYIAKKLLKISMSLNDKVFFLNSNDIDYFLTKKLIKRNKIERIHGIGVNLNYYKQSPFEKNRTNFLMISRLIKSKGVQIYADAAKLMLEKYPHVSFTLVGPFEKGVDAISISKIQSFEDASILEYLGSLEDVRPTIMKSSVFVLPTYYNEGLPRTILEAMSIGRPIITTNAPGCGDTVDHGRNGFLVPAKDPGTLAEVMEKFIQNPELIKKMGKESRKIAEEKYDVNKVNKVIMHTMDLT